MHRQELSALCCSSALRPRAQAGVERLGDVRQPDTPGRVLTGKERLGPKWTDEQRIDNCKVPIDKRGTKPRPSTCSAPAELTDGLRTPASDCLRSRRRTRRRAAPCGWRTARRRNISGTRG